MVGNLTPHTREWFEEVERFRYDVEPYIHSVAQFTRHRGRTAADPADWPRMISRFLPDDWGWFITLRAFK